ncbi:hypothetical protein ABRP86_10600, partial [Corynebacterium sp. KPL3927]
MDIFERFLREATFQLGIELHRVPVVMLSTLGIYLALGPNPGKWTRGFNQDAIVSVADPAAS